MPPIVVTVFETGASIKEEGARSKGTGAEKPITVKHNLGKALARFLWPSFTSLHRKHKEDGHNEAASCTHDEGMNHAGSGHLQEAAHHGRPRPRSLQPAQAAAPVQLRQVVSGDRGQHHPEIMPFLATPATSVPGPETPQLQPFSAIQRHQQALPDCCCTVHITSIAHTPTSSDCVNSSKVELHNTRAHTHTYTCAPPSSVLPAALMLAPLTDPRNLCDGGQFGYRELAQAKQAAAALDLLVQAKWAEVMQVQLPVVVVHSPPPRHTLPKLVSGKDWNRAVRAWFRKQHMLSTQAELNLVSCPTLNFYNILYSAEPSATDSDGDDPQAGGEVDTGYAQLPAPSCFATRCLHPPPHLAPPPSPPAHTAATSIPQGSCATNSSAPAPTQVNEPPPPAHPPPAHAPPAQPGCNSNVNRQVQEACKPDAPPGQPAMLSRWSLPSTWEDTLDEMGDLGLAPTKHTADPLAARAGAGGEDTWVGSGALHGTAVGMLTDGHEGVIESESQLWAGGDDELCRHITDQAARLAQLLLEGPRQLGGGTGRTDVHQSQPPWRGVCEARLVPRGGKTQRRSGGEQQVQGEGGSSDH